MLIVDDKWRLCYRNPTMEQTYPDVLTDKQGALLSELNLPFIVPAVLEATARLAAQTDDEGLIVPLQSGNSSVLMFQFTTTPGHNYLALMVLTNTEGVTGITPVASIFDMMSRAYQNRPENGEALSDRDRHLIQSEKMAAIGQLSAGVAHEINNPIGYICSNLNSLSGYVDKLVQLLDTIGEARTVEELRALRDQLDYDYIKADIIDCIEESAEGAVRVRDIIAALKDFSHSDNGSLSPYPLQEAFDTTLKLVTNEVKYKCTVHREFATVADVECSANQIKQVIMNLIVNAAHAIPQHGNIWLRLGQHESWVWLEVEDDGPGIPEDKLSRIFEPFFTTKPVGQGTGLGLSLSYSIIERHHGRIEVSSTEGKGSRFRVWLPVTQAAIA